MNGGIIGLVPAAGFATRMGELPCSKELLPIGWTPGHDPSDREKPLAGYLLECLASGGVSRALVITREEKEDIPRRLGDGSEWGLELDYLFVGPTRSTVETLDAAYERVRDSVVALGYPDIVFRPADAYRQLAGTWGHGGADVALGLFPGSQPERSDMVELGPAGGVRRIYVKQPDRGLTFTWSIALWGPRFTGYLHEIARRTDERPRELHVGDVIQHAIDNGLRVVARAFADGASTDLGTPAALARPPRWLTAG
jgi:glucose-1-phosphate thymidylyltransferase